jgi:hypothetical protein
LALNVFGLKPGGLSATVQLSQFPKFLDQEAFCNRLQVGYAAMPISNEFDFQVSQSEMAIRRRQHDFGN